MDKFYSVDELANSGKTTARTIRLYVDKGLLKPIRIGRTLCFREDAVKSLEDILRTKRLGFSLDEIKACRGDRSSARLNRTIKRIEELMSDAKTELADLHRRLAQIQN
ncbi:MAG: MerR family transcriptional regulator [Rhodospirillales bacterium]|nr:MerR family transcriptional regulator [Rhodospirillales bacterium]